MTELSSFPPELIAEVLQHLPEQDLERAHNVCTGWRELANRVIGFKLHIGDRQRGVWGRRQRVRFRGLEALSRFGTYEAHFSDVSEDGREVFLYPHMVRTLSFDGTFPSTRLFNRLCEPLTNLTSLTLHLTFFPSFEFNGLWLNFPTLQNLSVTSALCPHYEIDDSDPASNALTAQNFVHLMTSPVAYPQLSSLSVSLPFLRGRMVELTNGLAQFLVRNKHSLRKVLLSFENGHTTADEDENEAVDLIPDSDLVGFNLDTLILSSIVPDDESMRTMKKVMGSQTRLRSLYSTTGYVRFQDYAKTIGACAQTLTSLRLSVRPEAGGVDLKALVNCHSLQVLVLLGPPKEDETFDPFETNEDAIEGQMLTSDLHNVGFLPPRIRILKLFNLFLKSADLKHVTGGLGDLRILKLENCGRYGGLGLRLEDAIDILARRKVTSLSLTQSFNILSLKTDGTVCPAFAMAALWVKSVAEDGGFEAHLDSVVGHYVPGPSPNDPHHLPAEDPNFVLNGSPFMEEDDLFHLMELNMQEEELEAELDQLEEELEAELEQLEDELDQLEAEEQDELDQSEDEEEEELDQSEEDEEEELDLEQEELEELEEELEDDDADMEDLEELDSDFSDDDEDD